MYEALLACVVIIYIQDMSEEGHIVYKYNKTTVQQKYTRREEKRSKQNHKKRSQPN